MALFSATECSRENFCKAWQLAEVKMMLLVILAKQHF